MTKAMIATIAAGKPPPPLSPSQRQSVSPSPSPYAALIGSPSQTMQPFSATAAPSYLQPTIKAGLGQSHPSSKCSSTSHEEPTYRAAYRTAPTRPGTAPEAAQGRSRRAFVRRPAPALPPEHGSAGAGATPASASTAVIAPSMPPWHPATDAQGDAPSNAIIDADSPALPREAASGGCVQPDLRPGDAFHPPGKRAVSSTSGRTWHGRQSLPMRVIVAPAPPWRVEDPQREIGF